MSVISDEKDLLYSHTNGGNGSMSAGTVDSSDTYASGRSSGDGSKPLLELFVKASGIDSRRIGACLFCQEFW